LIALRDDVASFAARAFRELNPRTPFLMNWHIELIAAKLAAVRAGHIRRLIVSLPPRHLKSHLASIAFPAWCLGHEPSAQILCVSYAQDLADKLSRDCRRLLASEWYQRLFPTTRLVPRHRAAPEFETTAQGSRVATSVGGVLTGRGADLIVIDDPLKPEEALSQTQRQAANEWYDHTLYSRLNDKLTGAIVLIMHRLHESLPSGMTRGMTLPAMCSSRSRGRWCASRRSPTRRRPTGSRPCSGSNPLGAGRTRPMSRASALAQFTRARACSFRAVCLN
jgi:hypothetical protein